MSDVELRLAASADRDALYDICLRTGDAGDDASGLIRHGELYGHLYAGQYLALEPGLALVAVLDGTVVGYALGALDTASFEERLEHEWWPGLRAAHPLPGEGTDLDRSFTARLHAPPRTPTAVTDRYPSHLHIDLLPVAQGRGVGRRLIDALLAAMVALGSTGVHLGVDPRNTRAIGFYAHLGFTRHGDGGVVLFTQRLSPASAPST
ncbi:MAG: GNAT family N-acetyltransferase [Ilumatobacteraceae bacterium]